MISGKSPPIPPHLTIFLVSAAALLFQMAQTRLFSATLGYHVTYLVLSVSLLGVGAGATFNFLMDGRSSRPSLHALSLAVGASAVAALLVQTQIDPNGLGLALAIVSAYVLGSLPFVFASWVVVRSLREDPARSGSLYASDLAGAGAGSLLAFVGIQPLGVPALYALSAVLASFGALCLRPHALPPRAGCALAIGSLVVLAIWSDQLIPTKVGPHKSPVFSGKVAIEATDWDPHARVDVLRHEDGPVDAAYGFLMDSGYAGPRPDALTMLLDLLAATPILDGHADMGALRASILAAPYVASEPRRVLVVGPGGGIDLQNALEHGAERIDAVEVNGGVVKYMRGQFASYSGGIYADPRVRVFEDEARSFIRRSRERYDLVVLTVVDSFAALASGVYALSESYLYTEQAFADYVQHLGPGGMLAIGRWYLEPPVEMLRTAQLAARGLGASDVVDARGHLLVLRHRAFGLLLASRQPFAPEQVAAVRSFAERHRFAVAYDPLRPDGPFARALASAEPAPATDERPFFFATDPGDGSIPVGYVILYLALFPAALLSYLVLLRPIQRAAGDALRGPAARATTVHALLVGLGFIAAELVLLQRLTLYLGQPALALAVGLAALLLGAAAGSALSSRTALGVRGAAVASAVLVPAVLGGVVWAGDATLAAPLAIRILVAALAGSLTGMPLGAVFPQILIRAAAHHAALVPWAWAVNGAASVIGAIVATALAMETGFGVVAVYAAGCYVTVAAFRPVTGTRSG